MTADNFARSSSVAASTETPPSSSHLKAYLIVGVVAAAVSAATAAYIFWSRSRQFGPQVETVQDLLDRCHDQVREIEERLGELRQPVASR